MSDLHAPFTRRQRRQSRLIQSGEYDAERPLNDVILDALKAGEDRLTRTAQDERDIHALHKLRTAINRLQQ